MIMKSTRVSNYVAVGLIPLFWFSAFRNYFANRGHIPKVAGPQSALRLRLRELTSVRVAYGYRRLTVLLQREGWRVNHKHVYRLCREEGLGIRHKTPVATGTLAEIPSAQVN